MTATVASPVHQLGVVDGVRRQVDYWSVVYQRTWRATVVSSFLAPLLYVLAMGVLLGGFIDADPEVLEGATSYFDFVVPGLIAAHAMQTAVGETTWPVMGMIKWQRIYDSMLATPLGCRDLVAAHLSFVLFRLATTCGVYTLALAPFGVYATWWGAIAAFGSQLLVGMTFAVWVYGFSARLTSRRGAAGPSSSCSASRSPWRVDPVTVRRSRGSPTTTGGRLGGHRAVGRSGLPGILTATCRAPSRRRTMKSCAG